MCVLQESQAISLVSVAHVLGETHPHRGLRKQPSHSDDLGSEKADAGPKQELDISCLGGSNVHVVCLNVSVFLSHTITEKSSPSDTSTSKYKKSRSVSTPMAVTGILTVSFLYMHVLASNH